MIYHLYVSYFFSFFMGLCDDGIIGIMGRWDYQIIIKYRTLYIYNYHLYIFIKLHINYTIFMILEVDVVQY